MPCITMLVYSASVWAFAAGDGAVDDDLELLDAFSAQVAQHLHYLGAGAVDGGIDDQTTARLVGSGVGVGKLNLSAYEPLLRAARADARDPDWQAEYRQHRPMVERSIAWLTRGNRKVRYRGVVKNDHWLHHRTAALNLRRLITTGLTHTGTSGPSPERALPIHHHRVR